MQIAKAVSGPSGTQARALLVDLPDHGRSPWSGSFSFEGYAAQLADTLSAAAPGERWTLVGHSLGGKTAMVAALQHAELIERLCIVDIAPKSYGDLHRFRGYIEGMQRMPLSQLASRADADEWYAREVEPDPGVRAFLLQNLRREGDHWRWQANVELLAAVSRQVRVLEEAGLVCRSADPDDGRVVRLDLTPDGRVTAERLHHIGARHLEQALATWSEDERARLATALTRLVDDLVATPLPRPTGP